MSRIKADSAPPRKKRSFFSTKIASLPPLQIVRPPSPSRALPSDRVLAALQPDDKVVVAAKTFVKEHMGDDGAAANGDRPARAVNKAPGAGALPPPSKRVFGAKARKPVIPKVLPKRAVSSAAGTGIAQRIKDKSAMAARKFTLRSRPPAETGRPQRTMHTATPRTLPEAKTMTPTPTASAKEVTASASSSKLVPAQLLRVVSANTMERSQSSTTTSSNTDINPGKRKEYMTAGLYCQDAEPPSERALFNKVLDSRIPVKRGPGRPRKSQPPPPDSNMTFPPLPLDHGLVHFFEKEHEFVLPYNILWESETGALDGKKRPPAYRKLRSNQFIERQRYLTDHPAVCRCAPEAGCGDHCINRIMSYLCGKDCQCGELCDNKSLTRRKGKGTKVVWTGSRGFGLVATEDIAEGEFVIDYRGEVIHINTFIERIGTDYKGHRNFYALAYDRDEVLDAGKLGNDARFINHSCNPNLEVRKYQTIGDGYEEFEIGTWATRDIKAGEELSYDYNFESFSMTNLSNKDEARTRCHCGAPNCVGFLGRKPGEKSAKELAAALDAKAAEDARKAEAKAKRAERTAAAATASPAPTGTKASETGSSVNVPTASGETGAPSKRPRGRPRKHPLPDPDKPVVKRPRGRPPKHPRVDGQIVVKRGRGRPRKHPLPDPNAPVVKRPVGRPRKHPLPVPADAGPSTAAKTEPAAAKSEVGPKRVGRPPKTETRPSPYPARRGPGRPSMVESAVSTITNFFKRGPGRPPKAAAPPLPTPPVEEAPALAAPAAPVPLSDRNTPKQVQKRARNGAPAGWAYVVDGPPPTPDSATAEGGPRTDRAARLALRRGS
ncbi:hypothetical protein Q8F55_004977 [Vanrija albida]|uniref:Histone-lysine N-methyltransferase n=1 Tax=Vanrija albida TaxID=181172 RepID=A0ABR3Q136_9TREE